MAVNLQHPGCGRAFSAVAVLRVKSSSTAVARMRPFCGKGSSLGTLALTSGGERIFS